MGLFENVKNYFLGKSNKNNSENAPEGVCPNCWGKQEWEGEFYKKIRANNITPENKIYNSFIHDVVEKLDKITLKKDSYTCETCNVKYENTN